MAAQLDDQDGVARIVAHVVQCLCLLRIRAAEGQGRDPLADDVAERAEHRLERCLSDALQHCDVSRLERADGQLGCVHDSSSVHNRRSPRVPSSSYSTQLRGLSSGHGWLCRTDKWKRLV
jgi:hypothetical protein